MLKYCSVFLVQNIVKQYMYSFSKMCHIFGIVLKSLSWTHSTYLIDLRCILVVPFIMKRAQTLSWLTYQHGKSIFLKNYTGDVLYFESLASSDLQYLLIRRTLTLTETTELISSVYCYVQWLHKDSNLTQFSTSAGLQRKKKYFCGNRKVTGVTVGHLGMKGNTWIIYCSRETFWTSEVKQKFTSPYKCYTPKYGRM